jgi:hypothetical protein
MTVKKTFWILVNLERCLDRAFMWALRSRIRLVERITNRLPTTGETGESLVGTGPLNIIEMRLSSEATMPRKVWTTPKSREDERISRLWLMVRNTLRNWIRSPLVRLSFARDIGGRDISCIEERTMIAPETCFSVFSFACTEVVSPTIR